MTNEDSDLSICRPSSRLRQSEGVVVQSSSRAACSGGTRAKPSLTAGLLLVTFTLGAAGSAGLEWLGAISFRSDAAAVGNPCPAPLVVNSPAAVSQPRSNAESMNPADDPALIKGAGLERWWMDVQESVRPEE
jgi:hypothetical protein